MAQYIKTEEGYKKLATFTNDKMDKIDPTGTGSFSMNRKAGTVIGYYSHAEGNRTTASGDSSHAEGYSTTASGYYSHAQGIGTTASGYSSHAEGNKTIASGDYSHAEGFLTTAKGGNSHAEGNSTNAFSSIVTTTNPTTNDIITAWKTKKFSVAKGDYSHVEGKDNLALGGYSHAEGYQTTASGENSHAEGYQTIASKNYSHAEGSYTTASGHSSHAEGSSTTAIGYHSHAEGNYSTASGFSSHAEGSYTKASGDHSHVQGKCNIEDTSSIYADIIGNGTSNTARSNAATVDWNGNAWFAGDVYVGSTSGTNKDDGSKKLATEEYVDNSIAANSVLYTAQSLTEEQKEQARKNIGAQDENNGLTPVTVTYINPFYNTTDTSTTYLLQGTLKVFDDNSPTDVKKAFAIVMNVLGGHATPTGTAGCRDLFDRFRILYDNGLITIPFKAYPNKYDRNYWVSLSAYQNKYIFFNCVRSDKADGFNVTLRYDLETNAYVENSCYSEQAVKSSLKGLTGTPTIAQVQIQSDPTADKEIATKQYVDNAIANIPATDLSNCVQTDKENILGDNGSIISNSSRGNSLTISNGIIEQKNSNQDSISLGNAQVVFSHDNDGSSSTRGNGTFAMYGRKGEEYFKFKGTNGDVRVSGIATPTLQNDAVNKGYVDLQISNIAIPTVPTNVSAFTNDAGYLTAVPSEYVTETELNAKGYLTEHQSLADYALKSEIPSPYTLPTASATALGGVKVGAGLAIADDGTLSINIASAAVGQTIKVKAVDDTGKPTAWEAANMPSGGGGGGHWETVLDTVWEQDVINPTAFDSETGIFTCAEGELNNLELNKEYIFFQQCKKQGVAFNTIINNNIVKVTKLSDTTFSIDATPPTTFVPTNVKFSKGACLAVTDIDAKKIRLTLDGQFNQTATAYDRPFYKINVPFFGQNTSYQRILIAYQAYQQVTAEVESPYRIVGKILCGFNAPSQNGNFHFKNNSFCCPLVPYDVPQGSERTYFLTSDGTKIAKLYSTAYPWHGSNNTAISVDYLKIISGTKVKLERWVE